MSGGTLNQPFVFMAAIYGGLICGALYCVFRRVRRALGAGRILSGAMDVIFAVLCGVVCLIILYETTFLQIRLYHFLGVLVGFCVFLAGVAPIVGGLFSYIRGAIVDKREKKSDNGRTSD